jgi:endonuclease G, mitochondrial
VGRVGKGALVKVKIPSRFWKVIVARAASGVVSYGFLLEQDLSDVPFEQFVVPESFPRLIVPLSNPQEPAGEFPKIVFNSDQYATNEGIELAFRVGVKRRSQAGGVVTEGAIQ